VVGRTRKNGLRYSSLTATYTIDGGVRLIAQPTEWRDKANNADRASAERECASDGTGYACAVRSEPRSWGRYQGGRPTRSG
jgi:hypothetical protein